MAGRAVPRAWRGVVLDAWPLVLAVLLTLPLLHHAGYPLARDLVFVPHQPLTDAEIGLGTSSPRAVPLDAVVSLITTVVPGAVLARVAMVLLLAGAGWGAHRLLGGLGLTGRLAAGGFAVWNPYVVERLALGQWALLVGYASLPWLVLAAARLRGAGPRRQPGAWASVTAWLSLAALTPTGGLLGSAVVLAVGGTRRVRSLLLVALCLVLQLPWILPSLVGAAGLTSDPNGVDAFAARAEGPGGVVVALVGLGGVWDRDAVPATRESWWVLLTAAAVVAVVVLGAPRLRRLVGPGTARRLKVVGSLSLVAAAASALPGGHEVLRALVEHLAGAGLLRDSQKLLAPWVLLVTCCVGVVAHRVARAATSRAVELGVSAAVVAVALPLLLLPDAGSVTWPVVEPVRYPAGFDAVEARIHDAPGAVLVFPWRSYRLFSWGNGLISSDPAVRWFDHPVLVSDDLAVGDVVVRGEDPVAAAVGVELAADPVAEVAAHHGVAWVLVYADDPATAHLDLTGLRPAYSDSDLALYRVPGDVASSSTGAHNDAFRRSLVLLVDGIVLLLALAGLVISIIARTKRHKRLSRC